MNERWESHTKSFQDFFGRWGSPFGNLRSIWNACIPVAVVDRYRDDEEGSLFSLNAYTGGAVNQYSAAVIFNPDNDIEIVRILASHIFSAAFAFPGQGIHVFTPIIPYNPIANNLIGAYVPGLITSKAFTFSPSFAFAGTNPALPGTWGEWGVEPFIWLGPAQPGTFLGIKRVYDPPLRIYRNRALAVQATVASVTLPVQLYVSITWRERPRTTP